jgi:benzoyl-CoA reductase/2-hydroxyglutaryl-CoA dehydratase subunit BcrC/BadD/HgdB
MTSIAPVALETLREHYRDRDRAARAWKADGGRVVGYLCDNVPEELILAAGLFPYRLSGDPRSGTDAIQRYVQPFAAPFSARNRGIGFSDAMLNMLLEGRFDFLDFLIVPHTRKTIQAYYRELTLVAQANPELRLPQMHYLDRAYTPFYTSEVFNRAAVLELKAKLEEWSEQKISDATLAQAIETTNTNRRLLQQVMQLRFEQPPRLSGCDALQIIGASAFMLKSEHNALLEQLLSETEVAEPPSLNGPRLFVGGSPIDHLQLYELAEQCGAVIVAEDHCWGMRCAEFPLDAEAEANPLEALADRYHRKPACSIDFPMARVVERCAARAAAGRVDGAVFFVYDGDGVHIWDTPEEIAALEERLGIRCLYLKQQPYAMTSTDELAEILSEFVGSLKPVQAA